VITAASEKAVKAAAACNHILIPQCGYRIVAAGGVALIREAVTTNAATPFRKVRLAGRTGVVAETLLIGGSRSWSVQELANNSHVSPALTVRVIQRLEDASLLASSGRGPEKRRTVTNLRALGELWSQEEKAAVLTLRGFLYGTSNESIARAIVELYPGSAVGDALSANLYKPVLTRVMPPVKVWVPDGFNRDALDASGFKEKDEGPNLEIRVASHNPWQIHMVAEGLPRVSKWRAWAEIAHAKGRTQELAESLLEDLLRAPENFEET